MLPMTVSPISVDEMHADGGVIIESEDGEAELADCPFGGALRVDIAFKGTEELIVVLLKDTAGAPVTLVGRVTGWPLLTWVVIVVTKVSVFPAMVDLCTTEPGMVVPSLIEAGTKVPGTVVPG